jgi:hypothetical protein
LASNFVSLEIKWDVSAHISCNQIIFSTNFSTWRKQPPELTLQLGPSQRWHLAGSTGTRPGPVQLNASEALPYAWSRTPSSTRPAVVVWVAGPGRYGTDAARSHDTCDNAKSLTRELILISSEYKLLHLSPRYINGDTVNTVILYYRVL